MLHYLRRLDWLWPQITVLFNLFAAMGRFCIRLTVYTVTTYPTLPIDKTDWYLRSEVAGFPSRSELYMGMASTWRNFIYLYNTLCAYSPVTCHTLEKPARHYSLSRCVLAPWIQRRSAGQRSGLRGRLFGFQFTQVRSPAGEWKCCSPTLPCPVPEEVGTSLYSRLDCWFKGLDLRTYYSTAQALAK